MKVADVGCAQATLALLLAEDGHDVTAVDLRQGFLDYAASRHENGTIRFLCGNALEMEPPGRFDVVFCNQLVEHVVYPERLVRGLAEWLRPGGRLVIVPEARLGSRGPLRALIDWLYAATGQRRPESEDAAARLSTWQVKLAPAGFRVARHEVVVAESAVTVIVAERPVA